ncbi:MAG TPA: TM0106 family RecB-like putative nuclease [Glaciihabitans sp.]|nr:TM0106 family RecB-like putative nuclease [Glaciihabitans sp.]
MLDTTVVFSASDLTAAAKCEWAVMRRLDSRLGRIPTVQDDSDAILDRAGKLGDEHEKRTLNGFRRSRKVVEFSRPGVDSLPQAAESTRAALETGADVVFQGTFFDGQFLGFADFLVRTANGQYEVFDTKLARKEQITALLQIAAYSDQLASLAIPVGSSAHLLLGDGRTSSHRLRDILPVYRKRRARLQRLVDERVAESTLTMWGDERYRACGRCAACAEQVMATRDVLLVAGVTLTQRQQLRRNGVNTIDDLAAVGDSVSGLVGNTVHTLQRQAALQLASKEGKPPAIEVIDPSALAALPRPNAGDIFFDFEGDPLYSEGRGANWGLDYLFGLMESDGTFRAFWAHNLAEERRAFIDFLRYVAERREKYPDLHIYHYAAYERTHLLSLAARHGVGEETVDDLLRANVLVDLFPIVKKSLRVGSRSYSIKKLEPLYMGDEHREGVANAIDSVVAYSQSREMFGAGQLAEAQAALNEIAKYNEYDCRSTLGLRDWLVELATDHGVDLATPRDLELDIPVKEPSPVYAALHAAIGDIAPAERSADQNAIALASAAIDYHRREGKKFWQEHFDRLRDPVDQWADTRDVLIVRTVSVDRDWGIEGKDRNPSRILSLSGDVAPGSTLKPGHTPYLLYKAPVSSLGEPAAPGARLAHNRAEIIGVDNGVYRVREKLSRGAEPYAQLPLALAPPMPPNAGSQVTAIAQWGQRVLNELPDMLDDAAFDILRRVVPRGRPVPKSVEPSVRVNHVVAIRDDLLTLDHSYLAVQGPPGTGKTYTGSRVIAELVVRHGWKVGVVAQSHATVENMLAAVVAAGLDPAKVGKKPKAGDEQASSDWTPLSATSFSDFTSQKGGFVVGGTAWTFSNPAHIKPGSLDLLVIDEAGQFSLASTIASAVASTRLLLLGDPQQLPQVSQGAHPEPVDVSALGWLSEGHDVLPIEFGYFLAKSWRMHPAVCEPVSQLSYEGQLVSQSRPRHLEGVRAGLHPVEIHHSYNTTSSPEEADSVVELVASLMGRDWTDGDTTTPLNEEHIIVVAPYNAQGELIRQRLKLAGFHRIPVGTVDKFQGREAAVSIISLAASSAEDVPRGLEFLLLANRLNVAISRAQWAAYLLYSPTLTEYLPTNTAALAQLSAFIRLVDEPNLAE